MGWPLTKSMETLFPDDEAWFYKHANQFFTEDSRPITHYAGLGFLRRYWEPQPSRLYANLEMLDRVTAAQRQATLAYVSSHLADAEKEIRVSIQREAQRFHDALDRLHSLASPDVPPPNSRVLEKYILQYIVKRDTLECLADILDLYLRHTKKRDFLQFDEETRDLLRSIDERCEHSAIWKSLHSSIYQRYGFLNRVAWQYPEHWWGQLVLD